MSANNKVLQVLVPSGNLGVAAQGTTLDQLAFGQIGIFDHETKLALGQNGSNFNGSERKIFIAVGRNDDKIDESAGQYIPLPLLEAITYNEASEAENEVQLISGFENILCDTDYTLRMEMRNGKISQIQGTVGYYKSFSFRTGACPADGTRTGDMKDFIKKFYQSLKADETNDGFYKVTVVDTANANAVVPDIDAAANTVVFGILIESLPVKETIYPGSINPTYYKDRQTVITLGLVEGLLDVNAKITKVTESKSEEGSGYDLYQQEYLAAGWKTSSPYRQSQIHGLEIMTGIEFHVSKTGTYDVFHLVYEIKGFAGWGSYKHPLQTIIAIPSADTTTITQVKSVLDKLSSFPVSDAIEIGDFTTDESEGGEGG